MREKDIQRALFDRIKPHIACPNVKFYHDFESDMIIVTKDHFVHEIEIKISKADFKADFKKTTIQYIQWDGVSPTSYNGRYKSVTKHELLLERKMVNRFSYAFPRGLIDYEEAPKEFGIYVIDERSNGTLRAEIARQPKRLHSNPLTPKRIEQLAHLLSYRAF